MPTSENTWKYITSFVRENIYTRGKGIITFKYLNFTLLCISYLADIIRLVYGADYLVLIFNMVLFNL